jgi:Flp pilus assembly pilin Flp
MTLHLHYQHVRALATSADGQTTSEYGVVIALITIAVVAALGALAAAVSGTFGNVSNFLGSSV